MNASTIPVVITEEAGIRLATVGIHQELDVMLEWVRNKVPDLQAIRVTPGYRKIGSRANLVVIMAYCIWDDENPPTDRIEWGWAGRPRRSLRASAETSSCPALFSRCRCRDVWLPKRAERREESADRD